MKNIQGSHIRTWRAYKLNIEKKQVAFVTMHRYDASTKRNIQRRKCKHAEINTSADLLQIIKVQKHFCELQR